MSANALTATTKVQMENTQWNVVEQRLISHCPRHPSTLVASDFQWKKTTCLLCRDKFIIVYNWLSDRSSSFFLQFSFHPTVRIVLFVFHVFVIVIRLSLSHSLSQQKNYSLPRTAYLSIDDDASVLFESASHIEENNRNEFYSGRDMRVLYKKLSFVSLSCINWMNMWI